jgi:hypothetical protein
VKRKIEQRLATISDSTLIPAALETLRYAALILQKLDIEIVFSRSVKVPQGHTIAIAPLI